MSSIFDRLRSGAGKAAFEADKLRRIAAEQSAIKSLKEEVETVIGQAGQVAYQLHREGYVHQSQLLQICQQIDALQEQIVSLEHKVEAIRAEEFVEETELSAHYGRICPNGHGPIPADNNFCQQCGAAAIVVPPPSSELSCQNCGAPLTPGARFCTECGQPAAPREPVSSVCSECSSPLRPGMRFCGECGAPVEQISGASPNDAFSPPEQIERDSDTEETDLHSSETLMDASDVWEATAWDDEETKTDSGPEPESEIVEEEADAAADVGETTVTKEDMASADDELMNNSETDAPRDRPAMDQTLLINADALHQHLEDVREHGGAADDVRDNVVSPEERSVEPERTEKAVGPCPVCGTQRLDDALFCAECGHPFQDDGEATTVAQPLEESCPNCGAPLFDDALFCAECGHHLEES